MEGNEVINVPPKPAHQARHQDVQTELSYDDNHYGHYFDGFENGHPSNIHNGVGKGGVLWNSIGKKIGKGPLFYVISNGDQLKFGISSMDGIPRLKSHGSYWKDGVLNCAIKFRGKRSGAPRALENKIKKFFGTRAEKLHKSNLPSLLKKVEEYNRASKRPSRATARPVATRTGLRPRDNRGKVASTRGWHP
jgi:hypothetical protein